MVEEIVERRISFVFGSVTIFLSMLFFHIANCFIIHAFKRPKGSSSSSTLTSSSSSSSSLEKLGKSWKYRNIAISWIHAVVAGIWNLIVFYCYYNEMMENLVEYYNVNIYILVCLSTGYFLYDFIDIVINCSFKSSWEIILHHIVVFLAFLVNVVQCRFLVYNIIALLAEANSIFLHLRKLLQFFQVQSSNWSYRIVIFLNLFTFVSCRFLCIGWIAYGLYADYDAFSLLHMMLLAPSTFIMACINSVLFWRLISRDVLQSKFHKCYNQKSDSNLEFLENMNNGHILNNNGKKQK